MYLSRDQILSASDMKREAVDVPEWGGTVLVRALSGAERDLYEAQSLEKRGKNYEANMRNVRARLCALAICDEEGKRVFTDADVEVLGAKSGAALDRVFEVAARLSRLGPKDIEDLAGN